MIKKSILVKSRQTFEEHVDCLQEEHECFMEMIENGFKIVYDKVVITIMDNFIIIDNENSKLFIEKEKKNISKYSTPYGELELEVEGKDITINSGEKTFLKLTYTIKIGNSKEYLNELEIIEC